MTCDFSLFLVSIQPVRNWENLSLQMTQINLAVIKVILLCLNSSVYFRIWWNYIEYQYIISIYKARSFFEFFIQWSVFTGPKRSWWKYKSNSSHTLRIVRFVSDTLWCNAGKLMYFHRYFGKYVDIWFSITCPLLGLH